MVFCQTALICSLRGENFVHSNKSAARSLIARSFSGPQSFKRVARPQWARGRSLLRGFVKTGRYFCSSFLSVHKSLVRAARKQQLNNPQQLIDSRVLVSREARNRDGVDYKRPSRESAHFVTAGFGVSAENA